MHEQLLLLELNEVNFEFVEYYARRGYLPHIADLLANYGYARTTSEKRYEDLEPWIQWVTAHTGRSLAEHGIFRLGDIIKGDIPQIWELAEERGFTVGAISPMNAKFRLKKPAFFLPDPWTQTQATGGYILKNLHQALAQAVSENADARLTVGSAMRLIAGLMRYARWNNYSLYAGLASRSLRNPWPRAMFLDLLLADVFMSEVRRARPHFASLFLNAAAHIQHHYMFCAAPYSGQHRNPDWYVAAGVDPVREIYELYDHIVGEVRRAFPAARLMLATGLHQVPHEEMTFYWRLRDHSQFLTAIGVVCESVDPLMSRDFRVHFRSTEAALAGAARLSLARVGGTQLFEVDNRGTDLFVTLTYSKDIPPGTAFAIGQEELGDLRANVVFVALKNGQHDGIGYFLDTHSRNNMQSTEFPLKDLPGLILSALGGDEGSDESAPVARSAHVPRRMAAEKIAM